MNLIQRVNAISNISRRIKYEVHNSQWLSSESTEYLDSIIELAIIECEEAPDHDLEFDPLSFDSLKEFYDSMALYFIEIVSN